MSTARPEDESTARLAVFAHLFRTREVVLHGDLVLVASGPDVTHPRGAIVLELRAVRRSRVEDLLRETSTAAELLAEEVRARIELTDDDARTLAAELTTLVQRRALANTSGDR